MHFQNLNTLFNFYVFLTVIAIMKTFPRFKVPFVQLKILSSLAKIEVPSLTPPFLTYI